MSKLADQIAATLRGGMTLPPELRQLFEWIESRGTYEDDDEGRTGLLVDPDSVDENWTESGRTGGTWIEFSAEGAQYLHHWFGHKKKKVLSRLSVFAKTGGDGSMGALWLDENFATTVSYTHLRAHET